MIASGQAALASLGSISGVGFAIAKMIGFGAILFTSSGFKAFATETPIKQSAPIRASPSVRQSSLSVANSSFH